ncbi:MAG TPA: sigma-70 family RNA polymerase sigma factor [Gammaproteobacteria bacterium]|nr:sigma-70 family RNA polymerase sigma factor [Gammaproteobacteria bacterium]
MGTLTDAAEAVVVSLASNGDADAFDELVRRKQSSVRGLMRRLSNDAALAEDLAQLVFVEMWKSLPKLESPAAFTAWLRRISLNVWLQHFRKKRALVLDNDAGDLAWDSSEHPSHERAIDLAAALGLLPVPVRVCVVLAYQEGMSHGEIARATDIPLGTVKSHIVRGSARLRELLRDYGAKA